MMRSSIGAGGRQRLQERSDEGAGAHCVEPCTRCLGTVIFSEPRGLPGLITAPAARLRFRYAASA